jgi:hypothetical protein
VLRSLAAVVLFPFDEVLRGMVAAGQGIEALCLYLGLTRSLLDDHLARLALTTPHDRPLLKARAHGWSVLDTIRLIAWRIAGVHPKIIGERLGGRSAGAVRSKARRLGLRPPPRKLLHKPDPKTLRDPEPGFGWRNSMQSPVPATPEAACGRVAGVITYRGREAAGAFSQRENEAGGVKTTGFFGGSIGQRELPLFGVVGGTDCQPAKLGLNQNQPEIAQLALSAPEFVIPKTEADVDFGADLGWIGKTRRPLTNKLIVWICGMLMMGGLKYQEAAKRVGMKKGAFRTFRTNCGIPVDEDRRKFGDIFDERCARATFAQAGYVLQHCKTASETPDGKGDWFWVHKTDANKIRFSPKNRKRIHQIEGRYNKISILKGHYVKPSPREIMLPFAKDVGRNGCSSNSWSAAHA